MTTIDELRNQRHDGAMPPPPLTNAEKQKRWRERRNALAKRAENLPDFPPLPPGARFQCAFCYKSDVDVAMMIAGRGAFICDECVALCVEIIEKKRKDQESERAPDRGALPETPTISRT